MTGFGPWAFLDWRGDEGLGLGPVTLLRGNVSGSTSAVGSAAE
ncbi:hypothetical protein ARZXY2_4369 (plasmid) [Arthrobacter sp. ZXY-2]|nr:hypothetical protein ARZXY2_4369 [Arthrobacter sp. ZXY-2]